MPGEEAALGEGDSGRHEDADDGEGDDGGEEAVEADESVLLIDDGAEAALAGGEELGDDGADEAEGGRDLERGEEVGESGGPRRRRNISRGEACSERRKSSVAGSTLRKPAVPLIRTGK